MLVGYDQEMLIADRSLGKGCVEMFTLLYYQVLLNLGIVNTKPTITILQYLNSRDLVVDLKFSAHYVGSPRILDGLFSSLGSLVFDEHPPLTSSFLILLPYDLVDLSIFLHVVFEVNKRQPPIETTHIHHSFLLLVVPLNPCK